MMSKVPSRMVWIPAAWVSLAVGGLGPMPVSAQRSELTPEVWLGAIRHEVALSNHSEPDQKYNVVILENFTELTPALTGSVSKPDFRQSTRTRLLEVDRRKLGRTLPEDLELCTKTAEECLPPEPFLLIRLSEPTVRGNEARIILRKTWTVNGHHRPHVTESYVLQLHRVGESWIVVERRVLTS